MKNHRIIDAMNYISDDFVTKADEIPAKSKKDRKPIYITIGTACAAALVGVFTLFGLNGRLNVPTTPEKNIVSIDYNNLPFSYQEGELTAISDYDKIFNAGSGGMIIPNTENYAWNENMVIEKLPVFKGFERGMFRPETYISILERYAANIGETLTDVKYTLADPAIFGPGVESYTDYMTAKAGGVTFRVDLIMAAGEFNINITGYDGDIAQLLGYKNPIDADGFVYENSDDTFTAILNYNLRKVRKVGDEYNVCEQILALDCMGMYPAITAREAVKLLESGKYKSLWTNTEFEANKETTFVVLKYEMTRFCDQIIPFYEIGQNDSVFLVPAVSPEYISEADARLN